MWHIGEEQLVPLSIGTFLASGMSRMTEYIAIEDDNVMTPLFLQVLTDLDKSPIDKQCNGVAAGNCLISCQVNEVIISFLENFE